jgi:hypothetical protein
MSKPTRASWAKSPTTPEQAVDRVTKKNPPSALRKAKRVVIKVGSA